MDFCMRFFVLMIASLNAVPCLLSAQQKVNIYHQVVHPYNTDDRGMVSVKIELQYKSVPQVKLVNVRTVPADSMPAHATANGFRPDVLTGMERKQMVAFVNVPVFQVVAGQAERLVSFDLEVTETDDTHGAIVEKPTDVPHSVLASGTWYKIAVPARGVYKIDYSFLQSLGINPANVNPANIRIYGNGGTVLPEKVTNNQQDDLIENAIQVQSSGNSFSAGDYILFYANGPILWSKDSARQSFTHTSNYYESQSYYFLNFDLGPGKRMGSEAATATASFNVPDFDAYALIENDEVNLGEIGKVWWGNKMNTFNSTSYIQNMSVDLGPVSGPLNISTMVGNINSAGGNALHMSFNNSAVRTFMLGAAPVDNALIAVAPGADIVQPPAGNGPFPLQFRYQPAGSGTAYVDYVRFNYHRQPVLQGKQLAFRNWQTAALPPGQNASYTLQNASPDLKVWDITNPLSPVNLDGTVAGGAYTFTRAGGSLKEFIAFDISQTSAPVAVAGNPVPNQDLHGMDAIDFLIITPPAFQATAEDLAGFHRQKDGLKVAVVLLDQIYNEFSSGGQDIGGIRNFIRMFYQRARNNGTDMIKSVLFMGAASYDYKNRLSFNTNFVPTYETLNSIDSRTAYASDDYYALLDENEDINQNMGNLLDIGIGRIPAFTPEEARDYVNKVKHYASPASFGPWKNVVTYIADDKDKPDEGDMNHLNDCDSVNKYFYDSAQVYNVYKVYCDAFHEIATPAGSRYPMANKAINDRINSGTFLTSYSGHGSPDRWAHEAILTSDDYNSWRNKNKLPVMVTATCDFGRFDVPGHRSAGARLTIIPDGGSIAMITTTQVVYSTPNTKLNQRYTEAQFTKDRTGNWRSIGEALRTGKNNYAGGRDNNHRFAVLGDPALRMAMPLHKIVTEKIQLQYDGSTVDTDTLEALGRYLLSGSVRDKDGNVLTDFNGPVYVTIYDKKRKVQTVNPDPTATSSFLLQTNVIAQVQGIVANGAFAVSFIVPKDINYAYGNGKISYYANSDVTDASGMDNSITVGGYSEHAGEDNTSPIVLPFIDDDKFRNGGITGPNPSLFVKLYDDNGFNISGSSVGHDMVGILDDDMQNPLLLNQYYASEPDDYRKGYIRDFRLSNLPDGMHTIKVKAWDVYNNSGEGTVVFEVRNKNKGFISNLYNYPNPMTSITHFVFQHNQENEAMEVTLSIYTAAGRLVKVIQDNITTTGNRTEITWDGLGDNGTPLGKGVYFYRLDAKTAKGVSAKAYQKLVLLR